MPYIPQEERKGYEKPILQIIQNMPSQPGKRAGHFTYVIYRLLKELFLGKFWHRALGIGCMIMAVLEIYRQEHAFYEDGKRCENGEV